MYGEDEFWTSAALEPFDGWGGLGRVNATRTSSGRRALLRAAASTVLLASVGAVGGLLAMSGAAPFSGGRRGVVAGRFARERSAASTQAAGGHIWRERTGWPLSRTHVARAHRRARGMTVRGLAPVPGDRVSGAPAARAARAIALDRDGSAVEVAAVSVSSHPVAAVPVESSARPLGSASAQQSSPRPDEFGFER